MSDPMRNPADRPPPLPDDARADLPHRLDGARDLYLLALALGERNVGFEPFGRMIREARIHFERVIEEARAAGLDTSAIATVLGKENVELADSIRPDLRSRVGELVAEAVHNRQR